MNWQIEAKLRARPFRSQGEPARIAIDYKKLKRKKGPISPAQPTTTQAHPSQVEPSPPCVGNRWLPNPNPQICAATFFSCHWILVTTRLVSPSRLSATTTSNCRQYKPVPSHRLAGRKSRFCRFPIELPQQPAIAACLLLSVCLLRTPENKNKKWPTCRRTLLFFLGWTSQSPHPHIHPHVWTFPSPVRDLQPNIDKTFKAFSRFPDPHSNLTQSKDLPIRGFAQPLHCIERDHLLTKRAYKPRWSHPFHHLDAQRSN